MSRVAVFVDAGYLFAQGSVALTGSKRPRALLKLNEAAVLAELTAHAKAKSDNSSLLRIYWYDGALASRGLTIEHAALAHMDHIKLRLGTVSGSGQQKGVDSLIVTDLIDLARNHAIGDAAVLSGDEDVRIGVQIAQAFGVRVHLLGIAPCRGSQSILLMQEADTTTEWDAATVAKFLSVKPALSAAVAMAAVASVSAATSSASGGTVPVAIPAPLTSAPSSAGAAFQPGLDGTVAALVATLDSTEVAGLKTYWAVSRGVPSEYDGKLIARCRDQIGRMLTTDEKRHVRARFVAVVKAI